MPWVDVYRFRARVPGELHYRNGSIALEVVFMKERLLPWVLRARKLDGSQSEVILCEAGSRPQLDCLLFDEGFPISPKFDAPSRKIIERLHREGHLAHDRQKWKN